jgi:hypothetical protein
MSNKAAAGIDSLLFDLELEFLLFPFDLQGGSYGNYKELIRDYLAL